VYQLDEQRDLTDDYSTTMIAVDGLLCARLVVAVLLFTTTGP
jgi:hypothetical protein